MKNFQPKRNFTNALHSKPVLVFLSLLLLFFAWGVFGFFSKMQATIENKNIALNKVAELKKEKETLSSGIAKLKTDEGKEESIREKFGLAKEGEGEIIVVDDKTATPTPVPKSSGFFSFFTDWFK